jgi:hypothetical protein
MNFYFTFPLKSINKNNYMKVSADTKEEAFEIIREFFVVDYCFNENEFYIVRRNMHLTEILFDATDYSPEPAAATQQTKD